MSASEQTSASKREPGYYHVVYQGDEYIALWHDKKWFFCGDPGEIDEGIFDEIDERVIVRRPSLQIELIQERLNELDKANAASIRELRLLLSSERPSPQQQPETQHEKSLRLLRKYLNETPKEEIEALLDSIKNVGTNGPTVEEYFQSLGGQPDELSKAQERAQKLTEVVDHFLQWCELYDHTPAAYFHAKKVLKELQS